MPSRFRRYRKRVSDDGQRAVLQKFRVSETVFISLIGRLSGCTKGAMPAGFQKRFSLWHRFLQSYQQLNPCKKILDRVQLVC